MQSSGAAPVSSLQSFARDAASSCCRLQHVAGPGCDFSCTFFGDMDAVKGRAVVSERLKQKGRKPWGVFGGVQKPGGGCRVWVRLWAYKSRLLPLLWGSRHFTACLCSSCEDLGTHHRGCWL